MAYSEARRHGFSPGTPVSSPQCDLHSVSLNRCQAAHDVLHVMNARCVARDLHTITSGPLERACWRQFAAQKGDFRKLESRDQFDYFLLS